MPLAEKMRSRFFWFLDKLNGGSIHRHHLDIKEILSIKDPKELDAKIVGRLSKILKHASETTPFYGRFSSKNSLDGFPVINKNLIKENTSDFLSSKFQAKDRISVVTSGSTGTPFETFQNKNKKLRNTADTLFFAQQAGYELGHKLFYLKIWSQYNQKSFIMKWLQNVEPIDVLNLKENIDDFIDKLNKRKAPVNLLGYVSAFETVFKHLEKENTLSPKVRVNSIITMSEGINDFVKSKGEELFKCPVLSRYSNIENGIIAQQTRLNADLFTINKASYYVEVFDQDKDVLVPDGTLGRILVTDLYNEAMPMIRYDTGDLGVLKEVTIDGVNQKVLTRIEGRKLDQIFNTKGELISSYIVYKNMWKYTQIDQYQLIQKTEKSYIFKICISGKFDQENQLISEFRSYLGADAEFGIQYVDEIPLLSSGKRKKVVNEMLIK